MTQDEFEDLLESLRERKAGRTGYKPAITEEVIQKTVAKLREVEPLADVPKTGVIPWNSIRNFFRPAVTLPLAAAAVVLLFCSLFFFGPGPKPIVLMAAVTRAGSPPATARLEFRLNKHTFQLSDNGVTFAGTLQPTAGEGPDITAFLATGGGTNTQGQAVSLVGVLRLIRLDGRNKIRNKADLTAATLIGTRQIVGQAEEPVTLNFSATE